MAKSDTKKQKGPEIEVVWKDNNPEATYFQRDGYAIVAKVENGKYTLVRYGFGDAPEKGEGIVVTAKDTLRLMETLKVKRPDTLLKALGRRFALKEPHNCYIKILTSLSRRGIPYAKI